MALNLNIVSKFNPKGINEAQSAFGSIGSSIKKFAGIAVAAFATIGGAQFLKDSIKQASDLGESINAVNKAYGDYAKDVLALGDDVASRLGLSTVDFNAAAVRFSAFAERIAGEGGNISGVVDSLTTRAADFASVYNIEVSEALRVFQSGLSGEAEPLKRFGINLLDSEVKAYAYANGIANVGAQLTETEKVQARYGLLLESTAKTAGDFADTSDGLANSQRILQANIKNLQAQVGEGLTPVLASFTSALVPLANIIFPALADFLNTYIAPGLQKAADAFKAFTTEAEKGGQGISGIFDALGKLLKDFFEGNGLPAFFERIGELRIAFFDSMVKALPGIIDAFVAFIPKIVSFLVDDLLPLLIKELTGIIVQLAQVLVEVLPKLVEALISAIPVLLEGAVTLFNSLVEAVTIIVPALVNSVIDLLPKITQALIKMLPGLLEGAIKLFTALVNAIPIIVPQLIRAVLDLLPVIIDTFIDLLPELTRGAIQLFLGIVQGIIQATPQIIDATLKLIPVIIGTLLGQLPKIVEAAIELLRGLALGLIENAPRVLGEAIKAVGTTLVNGIKTFLGIQSPSRVFFEIGEQVGDGLALGMLSKEDALRETAMYLARQTGQATMKVFQGLIPTIGGGVFDVANYTNDLNAVLKKLGAKSAGAIQAAERKLLGGTSQQVIDALTGQATLTNPKTGMSMTYRAQDASNPGVAKMISDAIAAGYKPLEPLTQSIEQITGAINGLAATANRGKTNLGMGGLVTGPTNALIGELGPEVVYPLDRFESMMGLSNQQAGNNYNITINAGVGSDPVSIGRYVTDAIKRYESVSGKVFASA